LCLKPEITSPKRKRVANTVSLRYRDHRRELKVQTDGSRGETFAIRRVMGTGLGGQSQEEGGITLQIQVMARSENQGVSYSQVWGKETPPACFVLGLRPLLYLRQRISLLGFIASSAQSPSEVLKFSL